MDCIMQVNGELAKEDSNLIVTARGVSVWTPAEPKSWFTRKPAKPKVVILNDVTCQIKGGEFVAILGPSGAGKTTLLATLAGRSTLPSEGSVAVNGVPVAKLPKGFVEIVPQFEAFMGCLTVREHLQFMIEMKLGSCKNAENQEVLRNIISDFSLVSRSERMISYLSGGERRLLSLATSLLSSPKIIICDEPTTGLDSYNALLVIGVLKKLAVRGAAVICSIHQPSSILFKQFDSIILMADGRLLFYGQQEDCKDMFDSIGMFCPNNYNPAEFYIKAISIKPNTNESDVDKIAKAFRNRTIDNGDCIKLVLVPKSSSNVCQRNWFRQVSILQWRSSLALRREILNEIYQFAITMMISGTIIGASYVNTSGLTQTGVLDMQGFLWLLTSEVAYGLAYNAMYSYDYDLLIFRREIGVYSSSAYFVSRLLSFVPKCVVWPPVFVALAAIVVDLPDRVLTVIKIILILTYGAIASAAYGLGMGAMFTSTKMPGEIMVVFDLPLFLLSGAFLRLSSIPLWLYSIKYISHFFYTLDMISNVYWRQIDVIDCPTNYNATCIKDGATFLWQSGYTTNYILVDSCGLLMVTLGWSLVGYIGLKREEKKGYAY